ncbi:Serine/threonine-protein kinase AtPK2/AtPK19 [Ancistrocladus abbreviatus]
MVASQSADMTTTQIGNLLSEQLHPIGPPKSVALDDFDVNFTDFFGPLPVNPSIELCSEKSEKLPSARKGNETMHDDAEVICKHSHPLVGPSSNTSQALEVGQLTLQGAQCDDKTLREGSEPVPKTAAVEEPGRFVDDDIDLNNHCIGLENFEVLTVVGKGAFGKVYQVRKKGSSEIYAMKVVPKDKIIEKNHVGYMKAEKDILTKVDHPFIVKLRYSFQTKYRLYLVLDFVNGGHLFFQLYHHGLFREDLARVYAAEIVSAVAYLHANGIMHRDLKPENILLDADGHVILTDFGLAKQFDGCTRSNTLCGTVEYMAPETVLGKGHDKAADWWSVGVLLYEMLTGKPPFTGGNRQKVQQKIIKDKVKLPAFLSTEAHSLLKGLLQKEASKRLGSGPNGCEEIKGHKWFKSINWKKLEAREIHPSFVPEVAGDHCVDNFDKRWTSMPLADSPAASPKLSDNPFKGFNYVR